MLKNSLDWINNQKRVKKHKIISVVVSKRNPKRRIVTLDNGDVFRVTEDVFIKNPIHSGDTLSSATLEEITEKINLQAIREAAFNLLSYRMRSVTELKSRLLKKGFKAEAVKLVIQGLIKDGYLDDKEFARAFVLDKVKNNKIGPVALKVAMFPHNFPQDLLNQSIETIYREFPINDLIKYHLQKKRFQAGKKLTPKERNRLVQYLRRKGFPWDSIKNALLDQGILNSGNL